MKELATDCCKLDRAQDCRLGCRSLLEQLKEIRNRTRPELNLKQQVGSCASGELLHPGFVYEKADLLVRRPNEVD